MSLLTGMGMSGTSLLKQNLDEQNKRLSELRQLEEKRRKEREKEKEKKSDN